MNCEFLKRGGTLGGEVDRLWAEAVHRLRGGEIEERQGRSSLATVPCQRRRDSVSILEIRMELLGEERLSIGRNDALGRRIGDIMNHLPGWEREEKRLRRGPYGQQRTYLRQRSK